MFGFRQDVTQKITETGLCGVEFCRVEGTVVGKGVKTELGLPVDLMVSHVHQPFCLPVGVVRDGLVHVDFFTVLGRVGVEQVRNCAGIVEPLVGPEVVLIHGQKIPRPWRIFPTGSKTLKKIWKKFEKIWKNFEKFWKKFEKIWQKLKKNWKKLEKPWKNWKKIEKIRSNIFQ